MSKKKSIISVMVVSAFAVTLGIAPIASAAENLFSMQSMKKGYMVAEADKYGENKCGENRCGATTADNNKDSKVTKEEWDKHSDAMFEKMDANKDGVIDKGQREDGQNESRKKNNDGDKKNY